MNSGSTTSSLAPPFHPTLAPPLLIRMTPDTELSLNPVHPRGAIVIGLPIRECAWLPTLTGFATC